MTNSVLIPVGGGFSFPGWQVPDELQTNILFRFTPRELLCIEGVCKAWNEVRSKHLVWENYYNRQSHWPRQELELSQYRASVLILSGATSRVPIIEKASIVDALAVRGPWLAVAGHFSDKSGVRIYDWPSGVCRRIIDSAHDKLTCVKFDGERLVTSARDGVLQVWNDWTKEESAEYRVFEDIPQVASTKHEIAMQGTTIIVTCNRHSAIHILDLENDRKRQLIGGAYVVCMTTSFVHQKIVCSLEDEHFLQQTSRDPYAIATRETVGYIEVWNMKSWKKEKDFGLSAMYENCRFTCLAYEETRNHLAAGDMRGTISIWDLNDNGISLLNLIKAPIKSALSSLIFQGNLLFSRTILLNEENRYVGGALNILNIENTASPEILSSVHARDYGSAPLAVQGDILFFTSYQENPSEGRVTVSNWRPALQ